MKHALATIIAFFSTVLILETLDLIFFDMRDKGGVPTITWLGFLGGWIGTHYIVVKGTNRLSIVLSRGCLIGAIEWFAITFLGFILSASDVDVQGLASMEISAFMAVVCLIGFGIAYFIGIIVKTDQETQECRVRGKVIDLTAKK